jgi:hypothetical protein
VLSVGAEVLFHLRRELARRRDDERAHGMTGGGMRAVCFRAESLEYRQSKSGGLSGAGLRGAEEVAPGEHDGNGLRLDGGGLCVTLLRYSAEQLRP